MLERGLEINIDLNLPKIVLYSEQKSVKFYLTAVDELTEDSFCIYKVDEETMMNIQYVISSH